ncbi:MAG: DUF6288 domain-containing protein [Planctomycetota bacterium]
MKKAIPVLLVLLVAQTVFAQNQPNDQDIEKALDTQTISLNFENTSLSNVAAFIQSISKLPITVDPKSEDIANMTVTLQGKEITLRSALEQLTEDKDISFCVKDGAVIIATKQRISEIKKELAGADEKPDKKKPAKKPADKKKTKTKIVESKQKPKETKEAAAKAIAYLAKDIQSQRGFPWTPVDTAFAGMAFLATGAKEHTAAVNKAAGIVSNMTKYLLTGKIPPPMEAGKPYKFEFANWELAISGMFLAEVYAANKNNNVRNTLQDMVNQLVIHMEATGGWGHQPGKDLNREYRELEVVSNFAVAVFGMSKKLGLKIPDKKLAESINYIEKCYSRGGICYDHMTKFDPRVGRTAGAVFAFAMAKQKNHKIYQPMCDFVKANMKDVSRGHQSPAVSFFFSAVGALQIGQETWDDYVQKWFPKIIAAQNADGSFNAIPNPDPSDAMGWNDGWNPRLPTAVYTLILLLDHGNLKYLSGNGD